AALVVCLATAAWAGEDNPLKKAKVGDWIEYKMTMAAAGINLDGKSKTTLTAKDDKEATLSTVSSFAGKESPAKEKKIDLTKAFNFLELAELTKGDTKIEKGKEGKETITVGGKEYKCKWSTLKMVTKDPKSVGDADVKIWSAADVPLFGIV